MSTRSQLRFVDPDGNQVAQLYKHSDGYPSNIVPMLGDLRDILDATSWQRGPGYAAAQFIFMDKLSGLRFCAEKIADQLAETEVDTDREFGLYAELLDQDGIGPAKASAATAMANLLTDLSAWDRDDRPYFMGGHGVEQGNIHGDEAYIYEVTLGNGPGVDEWGVRISGKFESPEWEAMDGSKRGYAYGEGEDAWTEGVFEYDGTVAEAVAVAEEVAESDATDRSVWQTLKDE